MPITRPFTAEEDITMSISTTLSGLFSKYNTGPNAIDAKTLMGSVVANVTLGVNELIEGSPYTFAEKAAIRGDLKTLCNRAFRAKLGVVGANGETLDASVLDKDVKKPN